MSELSVKELEQILARRMVKDRRRHQATTEVLIRWKNRGANEGTWENLYKLQQKYPNFQVAAVDGA